MENINVIFKDGTNRRFDHQPRPGGSYSLRIEYKGEFVVIIDEWGHQTAFPSADVKEVQTRERSW